MPRDEVRLVTRQLRTWCTSAPIREAVMVVGDFNVAADSAGRSGAQRLLPPQLLSSDRWEGWVLG